MRAGTPSLRIPHIRQDKKGNIESITFRFKTEEEMTLALKKSEADWDEIVATVAGAATAAAISAQAIAQESGMPLTGRCKCLGPAPHVSGGVSGRSGGFEALRCHIASVTWDVGTLNGSRPQQTHASEAGHCFVGKVPSPSPRGGGGGQTPKNSFCTQKRPQMSGPEKTKSHFFSDVGRPGLARAPNTHAPPPPPRGGPDRRPGMRGTAGTTRGGTGHVGLTHTETQRGRATDGLWTEARGRQKQSNDPGTNQHILNTPTTGRR